MLQQVAQRLPSVINSIDTIKLLLKIRTTLPHYQYIPGKILKMTTIKYNMTEPFTDKSNTRQNITLIDKINKKTFILDIAVPSTQDIKKSYLKQSINIQKYMN